jgi:hypothetical protein
MFERVNVLLVTSWKVMGLISDKVIGSFSVYIIFPAALCSEAYSVPNCYVY